MTDQTLPAAGGSYIRLSDGTLQREDPASDAVETPLQGAVEDPVQRPVKAAAKPVKEA